MADKKYPAGSRFGDWFICKEKDKSIVRRRVDFPDGTYTQERLTKSKYTHLQSNQTELQNFVIRLNGKDPAQVKALYAVKFKHAHISPDLMDQYRSWLKLQIANEKDVSTMYHYLIEYGLNFFIGTLNLSKPFDWKLKQDVWGMYLINTDPSLPEDPKDRIFPKGKSMSKKVLQYTIYEMNRFLGWLHEQRPAEFAPVVLKPISSAVLKSYESTRKINGLVRETKYIESDHWSKLVTYFEKYETPWRYYVYLAYCYGLRRNESMGLSVDHVFDDHIFLQQQLDYFDDKETHYKPLKSDDARRVPHWFCAPEEAVIWIEESKKCRLHPDTLSEKFEKLCKTLEISAYTFHDIRRTFVTNAVSKDGLKLVHVSEAVGHAHQSTTEKYYLKDNRKFKVEKTKGQKTRKYRPPGAA